MKSLVFSQKVRKDCSYFLKIEDGVSDVGNADDNVDALELLVIQKLKSASAKLAFTDLKSHPLDVGAKIFVEVNVEDGESPKGSLVRYNEGEPVSSVDLDFDEEIPLLNRTTKDGQSDAEHSVIGSLNIFANAPENEVVLTGFDVIELGNANVTISVNTSDASEVVGGFGTPSVLGAWATLQLFRESLEAHAGDVVDHVGVDSEDYDHDDENDDDFEEEFHSRW